MSLNPILRPNYDKQYACGTNNAIVDVCGFGKTSQDCRLNSMGSDMSATGTAFRCASINPGSFDGDASWKDNRSKTLTTDCGTTGLLTGLCLSGENQDCNIDNIAQHTVGMCRPVVDNAFRTDGQPSWDNVIYNDPRFGVKNVAGTGAVSCKAGYSGTAVCNGAGDFDDCHKYGDVPGSVAQSSYTFMKCGRLRDPQETIVTSLATNIQ